MDANVAKKLDIFFNNHHTQKYKKKTIIINPQEEPSGVFYLKEGVVKMYTVSSKGEEYTINTYRPFSFFPMSWVLNGRIPPYYYECLTNIVVGQAPKDEFLKFIQNEPSIILDLLKRIYKGLDGYFSKMEYLMEGNAQRRLITELLIFAKRFGEKQESALTIKLKLTEQELASQIGITRETISRELHKLKAKDLINFQKQTLIIKDLSKLEEELSK